MSDRMIYQVDATREKILVAAERLFSLRGFFDVKMQDVADAIAMSRNTLYRYYRDKSDLALAILAQVMLRAQEPVGKALHQALTAQKNGLERFEGLLRLLLTGTFAREHSRFLAEFDSYFAGDRVDDVFRARMNAILPLGTTFEIENLLVQGQADGSVRRDIDPHRAVLAVINAIRGLDNRLRLRAEDLKVRPDDDPHAMLDDAITLFIDGLRAPRS